MEVAPRHEARGHEHDSGGKTDSQSGDAPNAGA